MSEENVEQTPESNEPVDIGEEMQKRRSKIGCVIGAVLLLAASPFLYLVVMFSAEGIGNSIANQQAAQLSPEVKALMPLNESFLKAATAPDAIAGLTHFKSWMSSVSFETTLLGCPDPAGNDSPDACMYSDAGKVTDQTPEQVCAEVIAYAQKLGATNEMSVLIPEGKTISKSSVASCVKTLHSQPRSAAWALFSPQYVLYGNYKPDTPIAIGLTHGEETPQAAAGGVNGDKVPPYTGKLVLQPLVDTYSLTVATTLKVEKIEVAPSPFAAGKNRTAALLDLIAFYRAANQQQDPRSKVFVDAVINDFGNRYGFPGTWKAFVTSDNKVHWIQVTRDDGYQICIAIERKNSTNKNINEQPSATDTGGNGDFIGNGDVTWGLPGAQAMELQGIGKEIQSMNADYYFGDYIVGQCG